MPARHRRSPGFTITELVVVIGIITLLAGILLPAVGGVMRKSAKSKEMNNLRQIGVGWLLYASVHDDQVLPGFVRQRVQRGWHVTYRFPDDTPVPPGPDFLDLTDEANVAGPWAWRLMPYLNDVSLLYSHRRSDGEKLAAIEDARNVAREPAFGYNALHVGGWWAGQRSYVFKNVYAEGTDQPINVVSRKLASIRRPSDLLVFSSSALRTPGVFKDNRRADDDGSFVVLPPILADTERWWGIPENPDLVSLDSIQMYGSDDWWEEDGPVG